MSAAPACAGMALEPWIAPTDGAPGWKIQTGRNKQLAMLVAELSGGGTRMTGPDSWTVHTRRASLPLTALTADEAERVIVGLLDGVEGVRFRVEFRGSGGIPQGLAVPARGTLTHRQFIRETRLGNLYAYAVPEFRPHGTPADQRANAESSLPITYSEGGQSQ